MCRCVKAKAPRNQHNSTTFSSSASYTGHTDIIISNSIYPIVNGYKVNVCTQIKYRPEFVKYSDIRIAKIVTIGVLTIHAMHHWVAPSIGLKAEGPVAITVRLHLIGIKGLNLTHGHFHRIHHFLTKRTVIGQKVDHPNCAGFTNIQIKGLLCGSIETIACPHVFKIENFAEMHIVLDGWRRSISNRRKAEQRKQARAQPD